MARVKAVFYLPLRDNDGRDLGEEIDLVLAEVFERFGGWTLQGEVSGAYRMSDGSQSLDRNLSCAVVLDEVDRDELEAILRRFRAKTLQEEVYLEIQRVEVRFIR